MLSFKFSLLSAKASHEDMTCFCSFCNMSNNHFSMAGKFYIFPVCK